MNTVNKVERIKKITEFLNNIETILRRIKVEQAKLEEPNRGSVFGFIGKFFMSYRREFDNYHTPTQFDKELLNIIEEFYLRKKSELEHELLNL